MLRLSGAKCCAPGLLLEATRLRTDPGPPAAACVSCPGATQSPTAEVQAVVGRRAGGTWRCWYLLPQECHEGETVLPQPGRGVCLGRDAERSSPGSVPEARGVRGVAPSPFGPSFPFLSVRSKRGFGFISPKSSKHAPAHATALGAASRCLGIGP